MPFHPRNKHQGHYNLSALANANPALKPLIIPGKGGDRTLDFSNPQAVRELNRALLAAHYGVRDWDIPPGYLCPPIPGRVDYLHTLADLLGDSHDGQIPTGPKLVGLDVGTGANLVYPLLGQHEYQWRFVGSDTDQDALTNASRILAANPKLQPHIALRHQIDPERIFHGIIAADEHFDFTLCNPPFHPSAGAARDANRQKWQKLNKGKALEENSGLNFGGQSNELICHGGESGFIGRMIGESRDFAGQVFWFSSLVSRTANIPALVDQLRALGATDVRTLAMAQGEKNSRLLAWTYLDKKQRRAWRKARWPQPAKP